MALTTPDQSTWTPLDTGGQLAQAPEGTTPDGVFTFASAESSTGFVRRVIDGTYRASWAGVFAGGVAATNTSRLNAILANASVKEVIFDNPDGGDLPISGTINGQGKKINIQSNSKFTGTYTISNATIVAPDTSFVFGGTPTLTNVIPANGTWSVRWFGATGSNSGDDSGSIYQAVAIANVNVTKAVLFSPGTYLCTTNLNLGYLSVEFGVGAMIAGNIVVTNINSITANPNYQIFANTLDLRNILINTSFSVKWIGARGDGVTDDSAGIIKLLATTTFNCRRIFFPRSSGKYIINSAIASSSVGSGSWQQYRTLVFEDGAIIGGTGSISNATIEANKVLKIADNTFTFSVCRPSDGMWSVRWQGEDQLNTANQTIAFTKAVAAINQRSNIFIPSGIYYIDGVVINCPVIGEGRGAILRYASDGTSGAILKIGRHTLFGDTGLIEVSDIVIEGTGSICNGLVFDETNEYSGRYEFNRIFITNCQISIYKTRGNLGNVFNGCSFTSERTLTNFHYYAQDEDGVMHAGLDSFRDCRFRGAMLAAIYINDVEGGGTSFEKCVFEYNYGFTAFFNTNGVNVSILPTIFSACWLEGSIQEFPVTINGITYNTAYDFYFIRSNNVVFENCTLGRICAENNSYVRIDGGTLGYGYGQIPTTYDTTSFIEVVNALTSYTPPPNPSYLQSEGIMYAPKGVTYSFTPFPKSVIKNYFSNLLSSISWADPNESTFTGSSLTTARQTGGGLVYDVTRFSNIAGGVNIIGIQANVTVGKWLVFSTGFRWVSGTRVRIIQTGEPGFTIDTNTIPLGRWVYQWSSKLVTQSILMGVQISPLTSSDAVFDFSCMQFLQFDSCQEANMFIKQNVYTNPLISGNTNNIIQTITTSGSIVVPSYGGNFVNAIMATSTSNQTAISVGSTPGGTEYGTLSFSANGNDAIGTVIKAGETIYFSGISGRAQIKLNLV